ncbi:hypothetical protein SDC9_182153 [bioreactor metagenome]|uniref:RNA 2',3'-cyclic phosphodiesterase n=1 Tax=bioreactor metagenome TaxID=1076179 RepID=A0A645H979_9ZZZZ
MRGIHWSFFARGRPKPFEDVLKVLRDEVTRHGLTPDAGHRPHVTICYKAPEPLETRTIAPIHWHISELMLAERSGTGNGWSYRPLQRWMLPSPPDDDGLLI